MANEFKDNRPESNKKASRVYYKNLHKSFHCTKQYIPRECIHSCNGDPDDPFYGNYEGWCSLCPKSTLKKGKKCLPTS